MELKELKYSEVSPEGTYNSCAKGADFADVKRYYFEVPKDVYPLTALVQYALVSKEEKHKKSVHHLKFNAVPYEIEIRNGMTRNQLVELNDFVLSHQQANYEAASKKFAENCLDQYFQKTNKMGQYI